MTLIVEVGKIDTFHETKMTSFRSPQILLVYWHVQVESHYYPKLRAENKSFLECAIRFDVPHGAKQDNVVKNYLIRGLMASYCIYPNGHLSYRPGWLSYVRWRHLYKGTTCTPIQTNKRWLPPHILMSCVFFCVVLDDGRRRRDLSMTSTRLFLAIRNGKTDITIRGRPILNMLSAALPLGESFLIVVFRSICICHG
jgi:hypothetical protein